MESKNFNTALPLPIAFNSLKHHLSAIKDFLKNEPFNHENLYTYKEIVNSIGGSLIDYYTGDLTPQQIAEQVIYQLKSMNIHHRLSFDKWVESDGKNYQCLYLNDGSKWALKSAKLEDRYVHIHPGRYSDRTIRVRSTTLKTALAYGIVKAIFDMDFSVESINFARQNLVLLPPMSSKSSLAPVTRLLSLFYS